MPNRLDFEAMLPFQLFALILLLVGPPAVGVSTAFFYAFGILLLAQFMILTRAFDRGRVGHRLVYWIKNELFAALTIVGPFAILTYLVG
jgi:hypothetical protein